MEIIIGRDKQTSKLRMSVGQQAKLFGANGSVPLSVSREHLSLTINPDCTYNAKNLNAQNSTFVNGVSIEKLSVTEKDSVEIIGYSDKIKEHCDEIRFTKDFATSGINYLECIKIEPLFTKKPIKFPTIYTLFDRYHAMYVKEDLSLNQVVQLKIPACFVEE